ncbi:uncharacterized protein LOC115627612 isoform X2 [Scaptodrosophila lebanonensis]|uniref:Uncharacterized protein LOC115627612 isoform X2 n=1 Tax=Drosophila lebanonensis TaxID=7225 RepID=A0A6J2TVM0_DROLE|nr:uncharacterized protein LOC115627612 isoform X2 [Scaptodrosophila lebanonensis]
MHLRGTYFPEGRDCGDLFAINSTCLPASRCKDRLYAYFEQKILTQSMVVQCGMNVFEELICCPSSPPNDPNTVLGVEIPHYSTTSTPIARTRPISPIKSLNNVQPIVHAEAVRVNIGDLMAPDESYKHLAAVGYHDEHYDGFVYRCTAVILTTNILVVSAKCIGTGRDLPIQVVVGKADLGRGPIRNNVIRIKTRRSWFNETGILVLEKHIEASQLAGVAEICSARELQRSPRMRSIGWGFSKVRETRCSLFEMSMQQIDKSYCADPAKKVPIYQHHCLQPNETLTVQRDDGCSKCLSGTGSVLHVERPDNSLCVAAIATPSSVDCNESTEPLYYTVLKMAQQMYLVFIISKE